MNSIPLIKGNTPQEINTSIISLKKALAALEAQDKQLHGQITDLQPIDIVTSGDMRSVTSNAVANYKTDSVTSENDLPITSDGVWNNCLIKRDQGNSDFNLNNLMGVYYYDGGIICTNCPTPNINSSKAYGVLVVFNSNTYSMQYFFDWYQHNTYVRGKSSPSGNWQSNWHLQSISDPPSSDGKYNLSCYIRSGVPLYGWSGVVEGGDIRGLGGVRSYTFTIPKINRYRVLRGIFVSASNRTLSFELTYGYGQNNQMSIPDICFLSDKLTMTYDRTACTITFTSSSEVIYAVMYAIQEIQDYLGVLSAS